MAFDCGISEALLPGSKEDPHVFEKFVSPVCSKRRP